MMADIEFFKDLPLNIRVGSDGDITEAINGDAIKQSLRMIVDTGRGTRIFLPSYGCRLRSFLFEPFDESTAGRIGEELKNTITSHEPRITIIAIDVKMDFDSSSYDINLLYRINATGQLGDYQVSMEKI
jgi:phage baseplate assembly protein W